MPRNERDTKSTSAVSALADASRWAFPSKAEAALFDPGGTVPPFIALTGGTYANSVGRLEILEVLPNTTPNPTDLPAPAFVRLVDGSLARWAGREFPLELGAKGDNATDNSTFFEDLSGSMVNFAGELVADRGVFKTNKSLVIPKRASFAGRGADKTVITAAGSTGAFVNNAVVSKVGPTPARIANLYASPDHGASILTFASAHNLAAGDVILICDPRDYSYGGDPVTKEGWRPYYKAGEFCFVLAVKSATEVSLVGRIYSDTGYDHTKVEIYKLDSTATGTLRGFAAVAPGAGINGVINAVGVKWMRDLVLDDIGAANSDNASFWLDHVVGCTGTGLKCHQSGAVDQSLGTYYGLVVTGCQHVDISQSEFSAYRHGVAVGGGGGGFELVCRDVHVHHSRARGELFTALDWHAPAEWCRYTHMDVQGDYVLSFAGNHNEASDINFDVQNIALYGGELTGADHLFRNWRGRSVSPKTDCGVFDIGTDGDSLAVHTIGGELRFQDISIQSPRSTRGAIHVRNRGCADPWSIRAENIRYDAPLSVSAGIVAVFGIGGAAARRIVALDIDGSSALPSVYAQATDVDTPVVGLTDCGVVVGTTSTSVAFLDIPVTFRRAFPRAPAVTVTSHAFTTSNDTLAVYALDVTQTGFTFRFQRADQYANFSGAIRVKGSWTALSC